MSSAVGSEGESTDETTAMELANALPASIDAHPLIVEDARRQR
jgi:hypothetical protein